MFILIPLGPRPPRCNIACVRACMHVMCALASTRGRRCRQLAGVLTLKPQGWQLSQVGGLERQFREGSWKKGGKDVSARVSPVELARGGRLPAPRRRPHNCSYGELPRRRAPEGEGHAGVLPFPGGTLCLVARGLSPSSLTALARGRALEGAAAALGVLEWPFALRPYLASGGVGAVVGVGGAGPG